MFFHCLFDVSYFSVARFMIVCLVSLFSAQHSNFCGFVLCFYVSVSDYVLLTRAVPKP
jgi:hypothetical protein